MIWIAIVSSPIDDKLVVAIDGIVQLYRRIMLVMEVSSKQLFVFEKVRLTQCNACVHEASKTGPERRGSSVIGSPRSGWSL
jgi:hypothetical protein